MCFFENVRNICMLQNIWEITFVNTIVKDFTETALPLLYLIGYYCSGHPSSGLVFLYQARSRSMSDTLENLNFFPLIELYF